MRALNFVFLYARKYAGALSLTVAAMILLVGADLVAPLIVRRMITLVKDRTLGEAAVTLIGRLALLSAGVYLVRAGLQFVRSYMAHVAGWGVVADVRKHIYRHLQSLSLRFFADRQTGQLMSRMVNDSDMFEKLIAHAIPDISVNVLRLVAVAAVLATMNWPLALLSMLPVPFIVFGMRGFARYVRPAFRIRQQELGELNATLNDNLSGIREIQAFTREHIEAGRIGDHINRYCQSLLNALKLMAVFQPFVEFSSALGTVVLIYFGGRMAFNQVLPIEDLVAFFLYISLFYQPIRVLSTAWEGLQESLAGADRVSELLAEEPDVTGGPEAFGEHDRAAGAVSFRNVSFRYERGDMVLEDISVDIPPRSVTALVGPTGVGKTTMVSLIPRFYDVVEGCITLDGQDIRELTLPSLRRNISIVSQDVFLFHGTARDNVLFGKPDCTEEEVIRAATVANAHGFITDLPQGYDTIIGERGVKLSGGQRQRLAIARAVLKDAPILILDEATSSVDTETELLIQEALERLMKDRTAIVIAHRLSTIRSANQIVVLEGSHVAQVGTHEDLMEQEGLYRKLSTIQSQLKTGLTA